MHFDSDCGILKAMLYLNDEVTEKSGPFAYVTGTHKSRRAFWHRLSGQAMPYAEITQDSPQSRQLFMRLPSVLRNTSHYGDDLIPGEELERAHVDGAERFVTKNTNFILFVTDGIHHGGMVEEGERVAIQLVFMPVMFTA
jgi:hypothetical protein